MTEISTLNTKVVNERLVEALEIALEEAKLGVLHSGAFVLKYHKSEMDAVRTSVFEGSDLNAFELVGAVDVLKDHVKRTFLEDRVE